MPPRPIVALALAILCMAGPPARAQTTTITIDASKRYQTIDGFGAAATGLWSHEVRDVFAKPGLASLVADDLGASIIRIGIPPTLIPVNDPDPDHLDPATLDTAAFSPPIDFIKAVRAKHPGQVKVIGSFWNPPSWMKTNNSPKDGGHLRPDRYQHFAKLCAAACLAFERAAGVPLDALSIQNEPAFAEPYESCVYTPEEYRDTLKAVATAFAKWNIKTRLFGPEDVGADPKRFMRYVDGALADPDAGPPLRIFALHGYAGDGVSSHGSPESWARFRDVLAPHARPIWMTETSGESPVWRGVAARRGALDLALSIHDALVYGNVSAWVYWQITGAKGVAEESLMILDKPTPKFYAAKQFFRYIRPGAVRIDASPTDRTLAASAFLDEADRTLAIVLINRANSPRTVSLSLHLPAPIDSFETIRSSATENAVTLAPTPIADAAKSLTLPAESIVTLRGTLREP